MTAGSGVTEGTPASFTVTATPAPASPLTVTVAVAQIGDFGASTGAKTVVIPTGGSKTYSAATADDSTDEPDGSVTVAVQAGSGYTVSATQGTAAVAVSDDDATSVTLAALGSGSVAEDGGIREITVTLGRTLASGETATAPLAVSGATVGTHFTLALKQGDGVNEHVTLLTADPHSAQNPAVAFAAGAQQATLVLTAAPNGDTDERTVRVAFGSGARAPTGQGLSGGIAAAGGPIDIPIANDDRPPPPTPPLPTGPSLSVRDMQVSENGRNLRLLVYLSESPDQTVTVRITTRDGTAENGADYRGYLADRRERRLTFTAGSRLLYTYLYIPIVDDSAVEGDETFEVLLSDAVGAAIARGTATVTIKDND